MVCRQLAATALHSVAFPPTERGATFPRMAPRPLRGPSRRAAAAQPDASRISFLVSAARMVEGTPLLARYLGQQALRVGWHHYQTIDDVWQRPLTGPPRAGPQLQ